MTNLYKWQKEPPSSWDTLCNEHQHLLFSSAWADVLHQGFNTKSYYYHTENSVPVSPLHIFPAGPFRIGYLGFPVTGHHPWIEQGCIIEKNNPIHRADIIRLPYSAFDQQPKDKSLTSIGTTMETIINGLDRWSLEQLSSSMRYNMRRSTRAGIELHTLEKTDQAKMIFQLYKNTINRHRGTVRYTSLYFTALAELSLHSPLIQIKIASKNSMPIAFIINVINGHTGYYLHGAFDPEWKSLYATYALLADGIMWAQKMKCNHFNLLMSPSNQPSLTKFKESWGGTSHIQTTYELRPHPLRSVAIHLASKGLHYWNKVLP